MTYELKPYPIDGPVWNLTPDWRHAWLTCECGWDMYAIWERNVWEEMEVSERKRVALEMCPEHVEGYTDAYFEHDTLIPVMVYGTGYGLPEDTRRPHVFIKGTGFDNL